MLGLKTSKEMKRHINIVSLVLATAMVFTACQKDENGLVSLNAEIGNYAGAGNAKMYVDGSRYTHWTSGDQVNINGDGNICPVDLSGTKAKITNVSNSAQGYLAVYPAGIANSYSAISSSIYVTLPSTQTYSVDASGNQIIHAPMVAYCAAGDNTLTFHNLCSLLKVTVNNDRAEDITMQSITVKSSSSTSKLSGYASIKDAKTENPYLSMGSGSSSYDYVTLDFSSASEIVSQGTSKSYYVVVPSFASTNITISVEAANATKSVEKSLKQNSAVMSANVVAQGPTIAMSGAVGDFDGFGTESSPFQIKSSADLTTFKTRVNAGKTYEGKYFVLINSIDLGTWEGIGSTSSYLFKGVFDGNNKTITYSSSSTGSYLGVFKHIGTATVKNLKVDCTITNNVSNTYGGYCGGIAGHSHGTTYQNCTAMGTISGKGKYYGGITARDDNYASQGVTISGCTSSVEITSSISGDAYLGGIVGDLSKSGSLVENCTVSGAISAEDDNGDAIGSRVGGIVGSTVSGCKVDNCTFTGSVKGTSNTNPIVGSKGGSVTNCTPADQND